MFLVKSVGQRSQEQRNRHRALEGAIFLEADFALVPEDSAAVVLSALAVAAVIPGDEHVHAFHRRVERMDAVEVLEIAYVAGDGRQRRA